MQRVCHDLRCTAVGAFMLFAGTGAGADPACNDYPTQARVEYVNECVASHGDKLASLYQCVCVIDRIAQRLDYETFVEASTYSKYSTLPGEGGGLFRDSESGKALAKRFEEMQTQAYAACGVAK